MDMGARESTARGAQETQAAGPPNYYELLQVDENATADEIKVCGLFVCSGTYDSLYKYFY